MKNMPPSCVSVPAIERSRLARIMRADTVTWGKAVAATGFKAD